MVTDVNISNVRYSVLLWHGPQEAAAEEEEEQQQQTPLRQGLYTLQTFN